MVKFKLIARNPTSCTQWSVLGDLYNDIQTVVDACREQELYELPEPWQVSIVVVEFDCRPPRGNPERSSRDPWRIELTSLQERRGAHCINGINLAQLSFLGGHDIGHRRVYKPGSKDFQRVLIG